MIVYTCEFCGHEMESSKCERCTRCNCPEIEKVEVSAKEFCKKFGHDGGEKILEDTRVLLRRVTEQREKIHGRGNREVLVEYYSVEFLYRCFRCGHEKRERRELNHIV